ncbi:MAG: hypothetical protein GC181_16490 [Bacteroidetes bacterium]|nr:hypothetical protein [Bacteroidota bacterium]
MKFDKLIFLFAFAISVKVCNAQSFWENQHKIVASDREFDELFGYSVSMGEGYAIVSSPYEEDDTAGNNFMAESGAAYIYERNSDGSWTEMQKIQASDRDTGDQFGISCAIEDEWAVVGAYYDEDDLVGANKIFRSGSAYVFHRDEKGRWRQTQKLVANIRVNQALFGNSVSIHGNYMVIGATNDNRDQNGENPVSSSGAAFVFKLNTATNKWEQVVKLLPFTRSFYEQFGCSVSINNNRIIVGAYRDGTSQSNSEMGAAYIFEKNIDDDWMPIQKLTPAQRIPKDRFGWSVDIQGDIAVIGAPQHNTQSSFLTDEAGAAYIFEYNKSKTEWQEKVLLYAQDGAQYDNFGLSVAVSFSYVLIGAHRNDHSKGALYAYNRSKSGIWAGVEKIEIQKANVGDHVGKSVDIRNGKIITGAHGHDFDLNDQDNLEGAGAAFILEPSQPLWINEVNNEKIKCYPNPANGFVFIDIPNETGDFRYEMVDVTGRIISENRLTSSLNRIELQESGIFWIFIYHNEKRLSGFVLISN